jgi:hypothetical protein
LNAALVVVGGVGGGWWLWGPLGDKVPASEDRFPLALWSGLSSWAGLGKNLGQGGLGDGAKGGAPLWSVNSGFGLLECVMCPSSAAAFARPGSSAHQSLVRQPRVGEVGRTVSYT